MTEQTPHTPPEPDEHPRNVLDRAIIKVSHLLSWLFIATVFISFYEVVMRYLFDSPTTWVHETASFIGGSLFIIGGIYAFAANRHVRVVLVYDAVSSQTRKYLNLVHHLVGLAFASMLAYSSYSLAKEAWFAPWGELRLETSGSVLNAPYPALLKGLIFIALCILVIQFVLHLIQELMGLRNKDDV
ncbi:MULTISPECIES: TRAP transporter small permease subunit [unclassified Salinivibrio]|jgi:TRAP-type mannitol/chloroaromatic compound transport system, small permease component|uniref:TRAP transporter small permease subunit n=1 Tax=unclassified Salinivibrio TaxID=2636825 RepID=UPI0009885441|nr:MULTISPECIES: TRAP transporter small permease subunit [unclassified Salinivibrio]MPS32617.1 TRAP transporter small permease subunit [Salinivibrio sp. VYel7]MPX90829.1 TRAP transporter small permease subunit [Salinivibrio sp. VYel1]MPX94008.1 TRAP transporter small permease subunit [Salinivibrio sp. VYel9]MPX96723.1 TRAP transporter small permease subunit [Salinivibrio sp. VYel6]MPY00132.1 TRAP transporter small permease subunit [Salinivibrio sp. VYel4]